MEVHYLPVYYPSDAETADPQLFADNVRHEMARYSGLPLSTYGAKELKKELWKRPPPGTDLGRDKATNDKWVFRRIGSLLNGGFKRKPVTASQFGELLDLFGPMQQLLERVLVGPLQSKEMQKRKRMRRRKQQQNKNAFVIRKGRTRKRVVPL